MAGSSYVSLLNGFQLTSRSRKITLPVAAQRVVAFVALQSRPVQRGYAAGKLWFRPTDCRAEACLRSTLWRLQVACEGQSPVEATRLTLELSATVGVDVREHAAVARKILSRSVPLDSLDYNALLDGELLPDWCDDWILVERERLNQLRLHALEALAESRAECRRYGEAVEVAFAALHADPLRERAHYLLIRAYIAEGNRVEAIRHYRSYSRLLERTLGLEPSPELRALVEGLNGARS